MARFGQGAQYLMSVVDRRRHQGRRVVARKAEHHPLVAGALVLVARGIDTLRDIGRLVVDEAVDRRVAPMEIVLLVADLADRLARDRDQLVAGDRRRSAGLAGEHDPVRRYQGLDATARLWIGGQVGADDGIRYAVANLVRMAL